MTTEERNVLNKIHQTLGRVEGRMEHMATKEAVAEVKGSVTTLAETVTGLQKTVTEVKGSVTTLDKSVRTLEKENVRKTAGGISLLVSAVISGAVSGVTSFFTRGG